MGPWYDLKSNIWTGLDVLNPGSLRGETYESANCTLSPSKATSVSKVRKGTTHKPLQRLDSAAS